MSESAVHISLSAEPITTIGSFVVTNAVATSFIASIIMVAGLIWAVRKVTLQPKSLIAVTLESGVEYLLSLIEEVTQNRHKAERFFPLLMTIFIFVLVNNWLGLLPGIGSIIITSPEGATVPLFRGATADLNTTIALALISGIAAQAFAIKELGLFTHIKKYISLNPIMLFIGILEIISELSRMVSFSFRLFGNIFAGEVLLVVISFLLPIIAPLPFFGLEIFVGFIQALVFTMLTLVFLHIATSDHAEHGDHRETASSGEAEASPLPVHS